MPCSLKRVCVQRVFTQKRKYHCTRVSNLVFSAFTFVRGESEIEKAERMAGKWPQAALVCAGVFAAQHQIFISVLWLILKPTSPRTPIFSTRSTFLVNLFRHTMSIVVGGRWINKKISGWRAQEGAASLTCHVVWCCSMRGAPLSHFNLFLIKQHNDKSNLQLADYIVAHVFASLVCWAAYFV